MRISQNLLLVSLASLLNDVSSEMIYPVLPFFIVGTLGSSPVVLGLIEGVAESVASLLRVVAGRMSDLSRRRKPLTIAGYGVSLGGKVILAFAAAWVFVLAARLVDRLGKAVRTAPRDALIAESVPPSQRGYAFGFHRMMDTAGAVLGVGIALVLVSAGPTDVRPVLFWALVPTGLAMLCLLFVRESAKAGDAGAPGGQGAPGIPAAAQNETPAARTSLRTALGELPRTLKWFLAVAFVFALAGSSNQFLLLREQASGRGPLEGIKLYLVYNIVYALAAWPAGHLSDRIGRRAVLVAGYAVYGATYLGFAFFTSLDASWVLWGVYGLYVACTEGVEKALISDLAPQQHRATVLGLHAMVVGLGLLPASLVAGVMWEHLGPQWVFVAGGVLGCAAALAMAVVLRTRAVPSEPRDLH